MPSELAQNAHVWVRLTFKNEKGELATAYRKVSSPIAGDPSTEKSIDPRLLTAPQLSARFGRDRGAEGLGRLPALPALGEQDFFAELLVDEPDHVITRIQETAAFLRKTRTATAPPGTLAPVTLNELSQAVEAFAAWYAQCGVEEADTAEIIDDLLQFKVLVDEARAGPLTGLGVAKLLLHVPPECKHGTETRFVAYKKKGKWEAAATAKGLGKPRGGPLSAAAETYYDRCSKAYAAFVGVVAANAFAQFVAEFEPLAKLYADYKRQAALLDFDDLLHHARDLLAGNEHVRKALAQRYPRILVDEFQDTDLLQAEILWHLCGEGDQGAPWTERKLRASSLFVVGEAPLRGSSPSGLPSLTQRQPRADAQSVSPSACGVTVAESESADRVCRDGLRSGERLPAPVAENRDVQTHHTSPCRQRPREPLHRNH